MTKFTSLLIAFALVITLSPASLAHNVIGDRSLEIEDAKIVTDRHRVVGEVTICNSEAESVRFYLDVLNETINSLYKRKLSVPAGECRDYELDFTDKFADMSNTGDQVRFLAKSISGLASYGRYQLSDPVTITILEGNNDQAPCGDEKGEDDLYSVCKHDFIYHEPTGLRIKVDSYDYTRTDLLVTHIRWGGVKKVRIYKDRSREVVAGDEDHTKVKITNVMTENPGAFVLELESR